MGNISSLIITHFLTLRRSPKLLLLDGLEGGGAGDGARAWLEASNWNHTRGWGQGHHLATPRPEKQRLLEVHVWKSNFLFQSPGSRVGAFRAVLSSVIYGEQPALCEGEMQTSPSRFKPLPLLLIHTFPSAWSTLEGPFLFT